MSKELCYVIDINGNQLSPTNYNKGWVLLRKKKAKLIKKMPFVIQLLRVQENTDSNKFKRYGIKGCTLLQRNKSINFI